MVPCVTPFSGQAHAGTCGHDRPTAASPPRLVRPVLASVVPPQSGWSGLCLQRVQQALSTLRPPENSGQVSKSSPSNQAPLALPGCTVSHLVRLIVLVVCPCSLLPKPVRIVFQTGS